jgi:two-component system NtrC family response regulator
MVMKPGHILTIDDERVVCDGCRLVLTERGHRVESRLAGRAGLDALQGNGFEVVLLDMKLPDINGMDALRTIRQEHPDVRIVVMTGYSSVQDAVQALKLGAFDYLQKPFSDDELVSAVEKAMKGKRLADENQALRSQIFQKFEFTSIVGEDPGMEDVFHKIRKVSPTDSTVLLVG